MTWLLVGGVALVILATALIVVALLVPAKSQPGVDRPYGVDS